MINANLHGQPERDVSYSTGQSKPCLDYTVVSTYQTLPPYLQDNHSHLQRLKFQFGPGLSQMAWIVPYQLGCTGQPRAWTVPDNMDCPIQPGLPQTTRIVQTAWIVLFPGNRTLSFIISAAFWSRRLISPSSQDWWWFQVKEVNLLKVSLVWRRNVQNILATRDTARTELTRSNKLDARCDSQDMTFLWYCEE